MNRKFALQLGLSLVLGGCLCAVAMWNWRWGDMVDSVRPLGGRPARVVLPAEHASQAGAHLDLLHEGAPVARLTVPAQAPGAPRWVSLPRAQEDPAGRWELRGAGGPVSGWALDFRSPAERAARQAQAALDGEQRPDGGPPQGEPRVATGKAPAQEHDPLLFRAQPQPDGRVAARVQQVDWSWLLPYALTFFVAHLLRLLRWGVLLQPLGRLRTWRLITVGSVGMMAILLLPLRLGEFVRPYLISRETDIRMGAALGTCVVERVIDGLVVTLLLFAVLAALPAGTAPAAVLYAGYLSLAVFLSALGVLLGMYLKRDLTLALIDRTVGRLLPGLARKVSGLADSFIDGLRSLPSLRSQALFLGYTLLYWGSLGVGFWVMFRAAGATLPDGSYPGLLAAYTAMAILAIGIIVPGGPGFAGNFEFSLGLGLGLFLAPGMLATRGAVYILMMHAVQFTLQVGTGMAFLALGKVSLRSAVSESQSAAAHATKTVDPEPSTG